MQLIGRQLPSRARKSTEDVAGAVALQASSSQPQQRKMRRTRRQKSSHFPFLKLPREIRQLIYEYTVPDRMIVRRRILKRHRTPLREDLSKCCIGLLGVNRQIYAELHSEWYSKITFRLDIRHGHIDYLNYFISTCDKLPSTFLHHSKMSVRVRVSPYSSKRNKAAEISLLSALCVLLSPGRSRRKTELKELEILFRIPALVELRYVNHKIWAESVDVLGYLKYYLAALNHFISLIDPPKISMAVVEMDVLQTKTWRNLQERDRLYDSKLLKDANDILAELAMKMSSTERGLKLKSEVEELEL